MTERSKVRCQRWLHATSQKNCDAIQACGEIKLGGNLSKEYDGALADPCAPRGIWFSCNTYRGSDLSITAYPESLPREIDRVPALVANVGRLLQGHQWRLYEVSDCEKGYRQIKYIIVEAESPNDCWCRVKKLRLVPSHHKGQSNEFVELQRLPIGNKRWTWSAVDAESRILIGVFFAPSFVSSIQYRQNIVDTITLHRKFFPTTRNKSLGQAPSTTFEQEPRVELLVKVNVVNSIDASTQTENDETESKICHNAMTPQVTAACSSSTQPETDTRLFDVGTHADFSSPESPVLECERFLRIRSFDVGTQTSEYRDACTPIDQISAGFRLSGDCVQDTPPMSESQGTTTTQSLSQALRNVDHSLSDLFSNLHITPTEGATGRADVCFPRLSEPVQQPERTLYCSHVEVGPCPVGGCRTYNPDEWTSQSEGESQCDPDFNWNLMSRNLKWESESDDPCRRDSDDWFTDSDN